MNLKYISTAVIPSKFANSVHVMKMCNAFAKFTDVELYAIKGESSVDVFSYYSIRECFLLNLFHKQKNIYSSIKYIFKVFKSIKKSPDTFIYGRHLLSILLLSVKGMPFAYESHSLPSGHLRKTLESLLFRLPNFTKLIVISNILKEDYLNFYNHLSNKSILVAHDGADVPNNNYYSNELCSLRYKVGYIGHLYKGRGIDIIIEISKKMPNIDFIIIGGMKKDVAYWKSQKSLPKNLIFIGHISHDDLPIYYNSIDAFIAPYQIGINQSDGSTDTSRWMSPMKIFEYMSHKKPIVCSNIPVLREVLNENNSILVSPDDVDEWVFAINNLVNDPSYSDFLSLNAFNDFIEHYTWEKRAKFILENI